MGWNQVGKWLPLVLVVGCSGKLNVGDAGGRAGNGGAGNGGAGNGSAGNGGAGNGSAGVGIGGNFVSSGGVETTNGGSADAGEAGVGGMLVQPPGPGDLGQPCITTTAQIEADGTPAKANVTTLIHCHEGLTCDASKHCTAIPDCPSPSQVCVLHRPNLAPENSGGAGGAPGGSAGSGTGGAPGGSAGSGTGGASTGLGAVRDAVGVMAMTADDSNLYWVEYGTRDSLGNYKNDGALMAASLKDGKTRPLATKLPGPRQLGITSGHAYVSVDGAGLVGSSSTNQVLRLHLGPDDAPSVVVNDDFGTVFVATGDTVLWHDVIKWQAATGIGAPISLTDVFAYSTMGAADATNLFFDANNGISRVLLGGGTPQTVVSGDYAFAQYGDSLYGVEPVDGSGCLLDKVAKTGGSWQRTRALGACGLSSLQIVGDRFFTISSNGNGDYATYSFATGLLSNGDPPVRIGSVTQRGRHREVTFQGTVDTFYWSDGFAIYQRSLSDLP